MQSALLADICAHPADDAPRLVLADWLDDHGNPEHAEFIRLQMRLASLDEDDPNRADLLCREWELLHHHGAAYRQRLPAWARKEPHTFRRGFIAALSLTATQFLRHHAKLLQVAPLEEVHLRATHFHLPKIALSPSLAQVRTLNLRGNPLTDSDLRALLGSPHLGALTGLGLRACDLTDDHLDRLARWPGLKRITHLDLSSNLVTPAGLARLFASPHLSSLRRLELEELRFGANLVRPLTACPALATLERLSLRECRVAAEAVRLLDRCPHLRKLRSLDLSSSNLRDQAIDTLAGSPLLARLTDLNLSWCEVTGTRLATLIRSSAVARLRRLVLDNNDLSDLPSVFQDSRLTALRTLSLRRCRLGSEPSARSLAGSAALRHLSELDLSQNGVDAAGAAALAASPHLTNLRTLDLSITRLDDAGVAALARSPILANLWRLMLGDILVTPASVGELASSPYLGRLAYLGFSGNHRLFPSHADRETTRQALEVLFHLPRLLVVDASYWGLHLVLHRPQAP